MKDGHPLTSAELAQLKRLETSLYAMNDRGSWPKTQRTRKLLTLLSCSAVIGGAILITAGLAMIPVLTLAGVGLAAAGIASSIALAG